MTHEQVAQWLAAYSKAWETYDPQAIGALFSADAAYYYHPYDEPTRGREAIVSQAGSNPTMIWIRLPKPARSSTG